MIVHPSQEETVSAIKYIQNHWKGIFARRDRERIAGEGYIEENRGRGRRAKVVPQKRER